MKPIRAFYFKLHLVKQFSDGYRIKIDGEVKSFPTLAALKESLRTFHYEYAAYSIPPLGGKETSKIAQGPNKKRVEAIAQASNKGPFTLYKIRVND